MNQPLIDKSKTALVVIDLQKGVVGRQTAPHASDMVVKNSAAIAEGFRTNKMPVFLVRVAFHWTENMPCVPTLTHLGRRKPRHQTGRTWFRKWDRNQAIL